MIVDVDTHWEAVSYERGAHPLAPWLDQLPSGVDMLAFGVAGDLLAALPEAERPTAHELMPSLVRRAEFVVDSDHEEAGRLRHRRPPARRS